MGTPYLSSCPSNMDEYVGNLTSSYVSTSNESLVLATSVAMFILATIFFTLTLFSRVSHVSSILSPAARLFLSGAVFLFLPVMSYLFSDAKDASDCMAATNYRYLPGLPAGGSKPELPPRARLILTWMLLVELLRKKVQVVKLVTTGLQRYMDIAINAATVGWLGYIVFVNLKAPGRMAMFGFFWLLCATKLVQRVVFAEVMKHSLAYDKNTRLVNSYMDRYKIISQLRGDNIDANASPSLKTCRYVVMGEEKLVVKADPRGYKLDLCKVDDIVTISKIWEVPSNDLPSSSKYQCPKRLCFSFALFKLLRRRIERLPGAMSVEETAHCRDLIFKDLCKEDEEAAAAAKLLFEVLCDEVDFLGEYYHSVHPVALASPFFFVVNYLIVGLVFCVLCAMITIISGNGNVPYAIHSIKTDNYVLSSGVFKLIGCLVKTIVEGRSRYAAFFATIDVLISGLLFVSFLLEQFWEFMVFLLSKWFMVSLLCTYAGNPDRWRHCPIFRWFVRGIWWASTKLGVQSTSSLITFKQRSLLGRARACCFSTRRLPAASLPDQAKQSIIQRFHLAAYNSKDEDPISNGRRALELERHHQYVHLARFCDSKSVAKVIVTWHIATEILDTTTTMANHGDRYRKVATRLSRYCAYLVSSHPELLPDHREDTKRVYKKMKKDLRKTLGLMHYCFSSKRDRCKKLMATTPEMPAAKSSSTVVQKGTVLGKKLLEQVKASNQPGSSVWEMLADLWVELIVYVAPSGSEEHVKGHEEALVEGGELVTMLWALATHTGVTRPAPFVAARGLRTVHVEDGMFPAA